MTIKLNKQTKNSINKLTFSYREIDMSTSLFAFKGFIFRKSITNTHVLIIGMHLLYHHLVRLHISHHIMSLNHLLATYFI